MGEGVETAVPLHNMILEQNCSGKSDNLLVIEQKYELEISKIQNNSSATRSVSVEKWLFRHVRKIAKNRYELRRVCMSVRPHGTTRKRMGTRQEHLQ
jgi:hypothetical protein